VIKIDPSLPPDWPEPTNILGYWRKREAEFDERLARALVDLCALAYRHDPAGLDLALRRLGANARRRAELTRVIARYCCERDGSKGT
jgi:hypothetical protein